MHNDDQEEAVILEEQALVQTRIDKDLKQEVTEIYEALGIDLPTAIRMFFMRSKMVRGIGKEKFVEEYLNWRL